MDHSQLIRLALLLIPMTLNLCGITNADDLKRKAGRSNAGTQEKEPQTESSQDTDSTTTPTSPHPQRFPALSKLVNGHCTECHDNSSENHGVDLTLDPLLIDKSSIELWERVVRKLSSKQMPPPDAQQPSPILLRRAQEELIASLDQIAHKEPEVGRTPTFRRLTRFEYQNAIRDLFGIEIDATALLPPDEISHGFDNITVRDLSPALLHRYITSAQKISRMVMESESAGLEAFTVRLPPDRTQEEHVEGLPLGTRGGINLKHYFSRAGEYEFTIRLTRDRNEHVEGLKEPHDFILLMDGSQIKSLRIYPPKGNASANQDYTKPSHENVDKHLVIRAFVEPGMHQVGATFIKNPSSLSETKRQPLDVRYNMYRHPRIGPAIFQFSITGPHAAAATTAKESTGNSESPPRNPIFHTWPQSGHQEANCAERILLPLAECIIRRKLTTNDKAKVLQKYQEIASDKGFASGIEYAISYLLVHPEFLFKIERDPNGEDSQKRSPYPINNFELASRLSFFLWSSIPDDTLLQLAKQNDLQKPEILRQQVRRMLLDPKSDSFVRNFAGQWLFLRNLDSLTPDARLYPNFDDNLRQALRLETELFIGSLFRNNQPLKNLIEADYTFLNERLAKHYELPGVFGSHFRKVKLAPTSRRGGLLRHGSILSVTSYSTRTSPVLRGKWVLENLLGTTTPPPPPDVPNLDQNTIGNRLTLREQLEQHRHHDACASCHRLIDPIGFALQNFDALGRWRELDSDMLIDVNGSLPDGTNLMGITALETELVSRIHLIAYTLAEKLTTYALGRGMGPTDAYYLRQIVSASEPDEYRIHQLIEAIVLSPLFQMRMPES